jgi:hypothetical protein
MGFDQQCRAGAHAEQQVDVRALAHLPASARRDRSWIGACAGRKRDEDPLLSTAGRDQRRETYSAYLKAELDDEIMAHWPQWEEALQACSAISTLTFQREEFEEEYGRRRSKANPLAADEALETLFRFSVIGYERRSGYGGSSWAFQYTHPEAGWDNRATRFKVHGPDEFAKLREN